MDGRRKRAPRERRVSGGDGGVSSRSTEVSRVHAGEEVGGRTLADAEAEIARLRTRLARLESAEAERRTAEDSLRRHTGFLETLLDTIPSPVFYKDNAGRYLGCNQAFAERVLGLPKAAIVGKRLQDLETVMPHALAEVYREHDERLFDDPGVQVYESQVQTAGGTLRDVVFHKATFEDGCGEIVGIVGIIVDVTEQKRIENELRKHRDQLDELVAQRTTQLADANARLHAEIGERERARDALRSSEERYRRLVETMNDGLFAQNAEGVITYANQALAEMLGYRTEELIGHAITEFMDADNARVFDAQFSERRKGRAAAYELSWCRADGREITTIMSPRAVQGADGRFAGSFVVVTDITQRRIAERQLRKSEERFAKAFWACPDSVVLTRLDDGTVLDANDGFFRTMGYRRDDVIGKSSLALNNWVDPEDRKLFVQMLRQTGECERMQTAFRTREGRAIPAIVSARLIEIDGEACVLSISRDLRDKIESENATRRSEARLRALIDNLPFDVWALDLHGRYVLQNAHSRAAWGNVLGKRPEELDLPPDLLAEWIEEDRRALDGEVVRTERTVERGGTSRVLANIIAPIVVDNETHGVLGVSMDVTDVRTAERRIRASEQRFEAVADYTCDWESWFGPDGTLRWMNRAVAAHTGYSIDECQRIDGFPVAIVHPDDRTLFNEAFAEACNGAAGGRVTFRIVRRDGQVATMEALWQPIYAAERACLGHRWSIRDIGARVADSDDTAQLRRQLESLTGQLRTLRGLLPVCTQCGRMRDDVDFWSEVEHYVRAHGDALRGLSICPACEQDDADSTSSTRLSARPSRDVDDASAP